MFEFTSPTTLDDALQLWNDKARWYAGGTDLIPETRSGFEMPARLINLKQIKELRGISESTDELRIGALTTLTEIADNKIIQEKYRALAQACELSASPQIRNAGTIGGNLNQNSVCAYYRGDFNCWLKGGNTCFMRDGENTHAALIGCDECVHVHPSDPAAALVALDAKIILRGRDGAREIAAAEFFRAPTAENKRMNTLEPDELISNLQLTNLPNSRSAFLKAMDRAVFTHAIVSAAVRLDFADRTAKISAARIVLGGVAPAPWRETRVEEVLVGQILSEQLAARAADAALLDAKPLAHNAYKVRLARVLVKRAILDAGRA